MYMHRTAENEFDSFCNNFKVILVSGMRQVGKSTLLQQLVTEERNYVNLDNSEDYELASNAPSAFLGSISYL